MEHADADPQREGPIRRVLITGANGQLGTALAGVFAGDEITGVDLDTWDVSMPPPAWLVRPSALTMPLDTELDRPSGLPTATAISPTCSFPLSAKTAGVGDTGILITAMSLAGKAPTSLPVYCRPLESVT